MKLTIRVAEELAREARDAAEEQHISLNQFCAVAIARAVGETRARRFFAERAGGLSGAEARSRLLRVLDKVHDGDLPEAG